MYGTAVLEDVPGQRRPKTATGSLCRFDAEPVPEVRFDAPGLRTIYTLSAEVSACATRSTRTSAAGAPSSPQRVTTARGGWVGYASHLSQHEAYQVSF